MSLTTAARSLILLGRCAPSIKQNASKIIVKKLELDQNLLMVSFYYFYEPCQICLNIFVLCF